jgi:hypothetical protein
MEAVSFSGKILPGFTASHPRKYSSEKVLLSNPPAGRIIKQYFH